jgi:hypothetical protein
MGENEERAFDCSHTILPDESSLQLLASCGGSSNYCAKRCLLTDFRVPWPFSEPWLAPRHRQDACQSVMAIASRNFLLFEGIFRVSSTSSTEASVHSKDRRYH